ncbi:MAG: response regulator [Lachnospiraceae bacterium]|nr:response regulator [Lachnospiraceae bacterium]
MGDLSVLDTLRELYITLTALLFDVALCIVVAAQSGGTKGHSRRFLLAAVTVTVSTVISAVSFFTRHADVGVPVRVALFFHLAAYMGNIFVTYYMGEYIAGVSGEDSVPKGVKAFNRSLLYVSALILLAYFVLMFPKAVSPEADVFVSGWFRALVGYVFELYYMGFCMYLVFRGQGLNRRSRISVVTAFLVSIVTFAMHALLGSKPLVNYLGVSLGLLVFYFSTETPDYLRLMETMRELEESRRKADAANRAKSEFLANMSHEIRTPINAVLGMNEMILREGAHAKAHTRERDSAESFQDITHCAENVDSAGKNLLAIINDILDFSKIEAGKLEIVESPYRLSSVLNDVCNMILFRAQAKKLDFHVDVDEMLPDKLSGDEVRVRQVITNLLTNAVKYTEKGNVTLSVQRGAQETQTAPGEESALSAGGKEGNFHGQTVQLLIEVRDTGIGIREEDLDKLFSKFERVDLERNKTIEGTGLGLAITGNLLQMMGGSIHVDSTYGEGSVFQAVIPQRVLSQLPLGNFRETSAQGSTGARAYHETFRAPGARILVVDDTEMNLTVIEGLLKETLVLLELCTSGAQALQLTEGTAYDLILMDQRMPGMNGTETLRNIRAQESAKNLHTPVIALTADALQGAKSRYLEEGFTDYLSKPVESAALEQTLLQYLPPEKVVRVKTEAGMPSGEREETPAAKTDLSALFAALPALDFGEAKRLLVTDDLIEKTLRQFCENAERNAAEMEEYFRNGDYENYTIKVHALKGAARMIGAEALSGDAEHLEVCGNAATGE